MTEQNQKALGNVSHKTKVSRSQEIKDKCREG